MAFSRFTVLLAVRLSIILVLAGAAAYLAIAGSYPTAAAILLLLAGLLTLETSRYVTRTNRELARFLDAARYADFGQRFELTGGAGFRELGVTFTEILDRFRIERGEQEKQLRHLKAILEHVPVPLISVHADERVVLWNNAARRLIGSHPVRNLGDLTAFGADVPAQVASLQPGERRLVDMRVDEQTQSLTLSASEIVTSGGTERLISLQNIQTELDGMQLKSWQDLVRVLTHEIMNSITPVSSLAKTASDLVADVSDRISDQAELVSELGDVKDAVETVARRSDGLMGFVESYQRLLRLPDPDRVRVPIGELFEDVARIAAVDWEDAGIRLDVRIEPPGLEVSADRRMIEQVLINLLQNAEHALREAGGGEVRLSARLDSRGHVTMAVTDDGPGIPPEVAARMFVPFYTTRPTGSGVGLALSRQIMNAHGGTISFTETTGTDDAPASLAGRGARFVLTF